MKIKISYFYSIRNFQPYMIPISTAIWDPKWYHDFKGQDYVFKKNNVYYGLRYDSLAPGLTCQSCCRGPERCMETPDSCLFLKNYYKQLQGINFAQMITDLKNLAYSIKEHEGFQEDPMIVLLVYEKVDNPCSERHSIKRWFKENGIELKDFELTEG